MDLSMKIDVQHLLKVVLNILEGEKNNYIYWTYSYMFKQ